MPVQRLEVGIDRVDVILERKRKRSRVAIEFSLHSCTGNYATGSKRKLHQVFLLKGKKMMASKTMKDFAVLLDEMQFIRVHKSHVINRRFVKSFIGNQLTMEDDAVVEVSRRKCEEVKNLLKKSA